MINSSVLGKILNNLQISWLVGRYSHEGLRPMGGVPSVGVFLRDPSPYLREFWRKPRKTRKG